MCACMKFDMCGYVCGACACMIVAMLKAHGKGKKKMFSLNISFLFNEKRKGRKRSGGRREEKMK